MFMGRFEMHDGTPMALVVVSARPPSALGRTTQRETASGHGVKHIRQVMVSRPIQRHAFMNECMNEFMYFTLLLLMSQDMAGRLG